MRKGVYVANMYADSKGPDQTAHPHSLSRTFAACFLNYSRLSLSRIPRDSMKSFEISVPRHIRYAELRKKQFEQPHLTNIYVIGLLKL